MITQTFTIYKKVSSNIFLQLSFLNVEHKYSHQYTSCDLNLVKEEANHRTQFSAEKKFTNVEICIIAK